MSVSAAEHSQLAENIARKYPIVDGHIDVPYRLHRRWSDVTIAQPEGDFDYPRAVQGGLDAPFMSIYVPADKEGKGARLLANTLIDQVEAIVFRAPEKFALARSATDIRRNFKLGKISLPLGMENGAAIEGKLENLDHFYNRGIRYITLAHARANHISDSSYDDVKVWNGLSPFGITMVEEMNRLGIMVDVSHVSDAAFYEVLALSKVPVIASHSSLRHFTPGWERNIDDEMLEALGKNGGVIMITFGSDFLSEEALHWSEQRKQVGRAFADLQGDHITPDATAHFSEQYKRRFPYPYATVSDVADHIDRVRELIGISHIGLGSDFDGVGDSLPEGLKDVSGYPRLIEELLRRHYDEKDIAKILGGNILRVMDVVEQYAVAKAAQARPQTD
ncbi:MAG: membrane dipeptidase [Halieaceae bacterium]|jgi:membrane dipeptidase|nr:membrane dipeptidase [Halieaceae bacterium]